MLGLTLGCGFIPGASDTDTDEDPGMSTDEPDDGPGSEGTTPGTATGTSTSGEGSTGAEPTTDATTDATADASADDGAEGSEGGEGDESSSTGEPNDPCEALQLACATFDGGELILFGLDSGAILDSMPVPFSTDESHSIIWVGNHVYACGGEPSTTLHQVDVTTGIVTNSGLVCNGVSEVDGQLLVRRGSPLDVLAIDYAYYDDFAAAMANAPSSVTDYPPSIDRMTATDDMLLTSWHSDDHFSRWDLPTSAPLGDVLFEGHDDWVMGMDVVEGQVIIGTWFSAPMRHIAFDAQTGMRTCEYPSLGDPLDFTTGLACHRTQDEPPPPPPPA
ncbi:MAG: hypothetical protein KDK70_05920 [Myxococcales bacterium]|nr:hypothetical protein [Myxococcales bacterium]